MELDIFHIKLNIKLEINMFHVGEDTLIIVTTHIGVVLLHGQVTKKADDARSVVGDGTPV